MLLVGITKSSALVANQAVNTLTPYAMTRLMFLANSVQLMFPTALLVSVMYPTLAARTLTIGFISEVAATLTLAIMSMSWTSIASALVSSSWTTKNLTRVSN